MVTKALLWLNRGNKANNKERSIATNVHESVNFLACAFLTPFQQSTEQRNGPSPLTTDHHHHQRAPGMLNSIEVGISWYFPGALQPSDPGRWADCLSKVATTHPGVRPLHVREPVLLYGSTAEECKFLVPVQKAIPLPQFILELLLLWQSWSNLFLIRVIFPI